MKDIRFVLGECTKSNTKYYFQYNNKVYFIIEKTPLEEKVLEKITNIRYAYEKWRDIKAESDEKANRSANEDNQETIREKDYSYTTITFEYEELKKEQDIFVDKKKQIKRIESEKKIKDERFKEDKFKSDKFKNDKFIEDRFREDKRKIDKKHGENQHFEKKNYKKNVRFEKNNSHRRNDMRNDRRG